MTGGADWRRAAAELKSFSNQADLGLHLTLTDHQALGPLPRLAPDRRLPPLATLLPLALRGALDRQELCAEIERQLAAFEDALGRPPDFVDGHHHVHHFPVISQALVDVLCRRYPGRLPYVRVCWDRPSAILRRNIAVGKTAFLAALAWRLRQRLVAAGIPANDTFRGIHAFTPQPPVRILFQRFLDRPDSRTLIACHPGQVDEVLRAADTLLEPRTWEAAYLGSAAFEEDLATANVVIGRMPPATA